MKVRNIHSGRFGLPSGKVLAPGEIGDAPDSLAKSPLIGRVFEIVELSSPKKPQRSGRGEK